MDRYRLFLFSLRGGKISGLWSGIKRIAYKKTFKSVQEARQSRSQSPQAAWSAGGRQERLWGNGIVTTGILRLTVLSFVTVNSLKQH